MSGITISEERGVRYLHFGSAWVQGAMRIARPWSLELEYTRDLMFPLLLRPEPDWPASVLQIGLGSASVTKFLYRNRPEARITVIEILPEVVATARQYFKLPEDSKRVHIEIGDGHDYVAEREACSAPGRGSAVVIACAPPSRRCPRCPRGDRARPRARRA